MESVKKARRHAAWRSGANLQLLALCLPAIIAFLLFHYVPLVFGVAMPFKDYKLAKGIWGSQWCGFKNFTWIFKSAELGRVVRNSLLYGLWFLFIGPIVNIIIALLLFDLRSTKSLKAYQTVMCFPNFMSMVVVGFITYALLSPRFGVLTSLLNRLGYANVNVYTLPAAWPPILTIVNVWKGVGMGSMLYYAALVGIDPELFEAATIDGASHLQKTRYISVPLVMSIFCIQLILGIHSILGGSFDLFYLIPRNQGVLYSTTDVVTTFVTRALFDGDYLRGTSVTLIQSVIGLILIVACNAVVRRISPENAMF